MYFLTKLLLFKALITVIGSLNWDREWWQIKLRVTKVKLKKEPIICFWILFCRRRKMFKETCNTKTQPRYGWKFTKAVNFELTKTLLSISTDWWLFLSEVKFLPLSSTYSACSILVIWSILSTVSAPRMLFWAVHLVWNCKKVLIPSMSLERETSIVFFKFG